MSAKRLSLDDTIECLQYIAKSPSKENGGFNAETVRIAKAALWHLRQQKKENKEKS